MLYIIVFVGLCTLSNRNKILGVCEKIVWFISTWRSEFVQPWFMLYPKEWNVKYDIPITTRWG
jgi:hypothetical protein